MLPLRPPSTDGPRPAFPPTRSPGDRRRGRIPKALGGAVGRRRAGGVGLCAHDSRRVPDRCRQLRRRGSVPTDGSPRRSVPDVRPMCLLLVPVTDDEFRWVPIATAVTYVVLAGASLLDARSRKRFLVASTSRAASSSGRAGDFNPRAPGSSPGGPLLPHCDAEPLKRWLSQHNRGRPTDRDGSPT